MRNLLNKLVFDADGSFLFAGPENGGVRSPNSLGTNTWLFRAKRRRKYFSQNSKPDAKLIQGTLLYSRGSATFLVVA